MPAWSLYLALVTLFFLAGTTLFFFTLTRGALVLRGAFGVRDEAAHVYPIYSNMWLIKLVDWQPVIAAILLFQYDRLVSAITSDMRAMDFTSCAFGNVIPRVVGAALEAGAKRVLIADIINNELTHAQSKLRAYPGKLAFLNENATAMKQADGSVDANVIFFLLHELPHHLKGAACARPDGCWRRAASCIWPNFIAPIRSCCARSAGSTSKSSSHWDWRSGALTIL